MTDFIATTEPRWVNDRPAAFSIVSCFYPERSSKDVPGPVLRPGLILEVFESKAGGRFACRVAYGTKNLKIMSRQHLDVIVQNATNMDQFGLYYATRFDLNNTAVLPWERTFFGCWSGYETPVIGNLTEPYIKDYAYKMMVRLSRIPN